MDVNNSLMALFSLQQKLIKIKTLRVNQFEHGLQKMFSSMLLIQIFIMILLSLLHHKNSFKILKNLVELNGLTSRHTYH